MSTVAAVTDLKCDLMQSQQWLHFWGTLYTCSYFACMKNDIADIQKLLMKCVALLTT